MNSNWGGARLGAGAKSKWMTAGGTKLIRVPVALSEQILAAARSIDTGQNDNVTQSSNGCVAIETELEQVRSQLAALKAERDELDREVNELHGKNGDLHLELAMLKEKYSNACNSRDILLKAIDRFIAIKRIAWGDNPTQKGEFKTDSRTWDIFRQFHAYVEQCPELEGEL